MRMPTATKTNDNDAKSSKENSKEPESYNPLLKIVEIVEKKIRNLEKRRLKLEALRNEKENGKKLDDGQLEAIGRISEVEQQIELAKEMQKAVQLQLKEQTKMMKEAQRQEIRERKRQQTDMLHNLMQYQDLLNFMGEERVKKTFLDGSNGAIKLTLEEIQLCDSLFEILCPDMGKDLNMEQFHAKLDNSADLAQKLISGSPKSVLSDHTGRSMKDLLDRIIDCAFISQNRTKSPPIETSEFVDTSSFDMLIENSSLSSLHTEKTKDHRNLVFVDSNVPPLDSAVAYETDASNPTGYTPPQGALSYPLDFAPVYATDVFSLTSAGIAPKSPPPPIPLPHETPFTGSANKFMITETRTNIATADLNVGGFHEEESRADNSNYRGGRGRGRGSRGYNDEPHKRDSGRGRGGGRGTQLNNYRIGRDSGFYRGRGGMNRSRGGRQNNRGY